jgi:hypothetical protein
MRRTATAAVTLTALCLAGCALDTEETAETRGDDEAGEAQEALIQFIDSIKFQTTWRSRTFPVPKGSTVRAAATVSWDRPSACKLPKVTIALTKLGMMLNSTIGEHESATDAKVHTFTWTGLEAGNYRIDIGSINDNPTCRGIGSLTLSVTP